MTFDAGNVRHINFHCNVAQYGKASVTHSSVIPVSIAENCRKETGFYRAMHYSAKRGTVKHYILAAS